MFCRIFQHQHPGLDVRKIRRTDERRQHRKVASPQQCFAHRARSCQWRGLARRTCHGRQSPPGTLPPAQQKVLKTGLHDLVHHLRATKVIVYTRTDPARRAGLGVECALQRGKVAKPDKTRTTLDRPRQRRVADSTQDSGQAIPTTADQRHIRAAGGSPVNRRKARRVITGKPHVRRQGILVDLHLVAHCTQARHAAPKRQLVALRAGR